MPSRGKSTAATSASLNPKFPRLHVSLAIAVLNTKPAALSVREYILQLRQGLRPGRREHDAPATRQFLTAVRYWQQRCEIAEAAGERLQLENSKLERHINELKSADSEGSVALVPTISKKRKNAAESASTRPGKQQKPPRKDTSLEKIGPDRDNLADDFEYWSNARGGASLAQHLFSVHKLLKGTMNSQKLSYHLTQVSSALTTILITACTQYQQRILRTDSSEGHRQTSIPAPTLAAYDGELTSVFRAAARASTAMLYGVSKLDQGDHYRECRGAAVHAIVGSFSSLMDAMKDLAQAQAKHDMTKNDVASEPSTSRTSKKATAKTPKKSKGQDVVQTLSGFLSAIVASLNTTEPLHRELFEGFFCVLLSHVGNRLYFSTFGYEPTGTAEGDIEATERYRSIEEEETQDEGAGEQMDEVAELKARTIDLQVPGLVHLLDRAVAMAPQHLGSASSSAATSKISKTAKAFSPNKGRPKPGQSSLKNALTPVVRERLQQTLINSMFGEESRDEFSDCLRMPVRVNAAPQPDKVDEGEKAEWFKQEVWRLLGWEILAREGDW